MVNRKGSARKRLWPRLYLAIPAYTGVFPRHRHVALYSRYTLSTDHRLINNTYVKRHVRKIRSATAGLDDPEFDSRQGTRFFFSPQHPDQLWDPPIFLYNAYRGSFPRVELPGHEVEHSHPSI